MPIVLDGQLRDNPQIRSEETAPAEWNEPRRSDRALIAKAGYNISRQQFPQEIGELILTKHVPAQLSAKYRRAAMKGAAPRQLEDGTWYADIPGFEGVWANEATLQDCLNGLDEVLLDWLLLKIEDGDRDIPVVEGIDLNVL